MAFRINTQPSASTNTYGQQEKAAGFINIYIPTKDGKRSQLGKGIALRAGNADEAKLLTWLKGTQPIKVKADDGTECEMTPVELLQATIQVEFREVSDEPKAFALPGM